MIATPEEGRKRGREERGRESGIETRVIQREIEMREEVSFCES